MLKFLHLFYCLFGAKFFCYHRMAMKNNSFGIQVDGKILKIWLLRREQSSGDWKTRSFFPLVTLIPCGAMQTVRKLTDMAGNGFQGDGSPDSREATGRSCQTKPCLLWDSLWGFCQPTSQRITALWQLTTQFLGWAILVKVCQTLLDEWDNGYGSILPMHTGTSPANDQRIADQTTLEHLDSC